MCCTSVFMNGGSQAVRIPAAYRFSTDRVSVEVVDGGLLLRPVERETPSWTDFFRKCDQDGESFKDLLLARPDNVVPQEKDIF